MTGEGFRFLLHGAGSGAWNMAVDETLAASPAARAGLALRFYRWTAPTVSLGHHQDPAILDAAALRAAGAAWVRRPTGGTAVMHDGEITYALAARPGGVWSGTAAGLVGLLGAALARALGRWGVAAAGEPLERAAGPPGGRAGAACFSGGGRGEVWVAGRKIAGLAARRWGRGLLVHGSLLRGPEHLALPGLMALDGTARETLRGELLRRTVCLADLLAEPPELEELARETAAALETALGIRAIAADLEPGEREAARAIVPLVAAGSA